MTDNNWKDNKNGKEKSNGEQKKNWTNLIDKIYLIESGSKELLITIMHQIILNGKENKVMMI